MPSSIEFRPQALDSAEATRLIGALNDELSRTYPEPGATHFRLDPHEVGGGRGLFLVGYVEGVPVACGAVRLLADGDAELKRMYVAPERRSDGYGRALLDALEIAARELGAQRLVLETGTRQTAALKLYERAGFVSIPPFGEYADSPLSLCLAKELPEVRGAP